MPRKSLMYEIIEKKRRCGKRGKKEGSRKGERKREYE